MFELALVFLVGVVCGISLVAAAARRVAARHAHRQSLLRATLDINRMVIEARSRMLAAALDAMHRERLG